MHPADFTSPLVVLSHLFSILYLLIINELQRSLAFGNSKAKLLQAKTYAFGW